MARKLSYEKLEQRVKISGKAVSNQKQLEKALQKNSNELNERVKELNCLYGISKLVENNGRSLEEVLQGTVELIPPSWQFPEITCSRIVIQDKAFATKNFKESSWKLSSDIIVHGERFGAVEVCYLEERNEFDEGPFLTEERSLINAIAEGLGRIVERNMSEEALQNQTHKLGERVKELNCLYGISSLVEKQGIAVESILQGTVDLIPPSWQYPEITCARVILRNREFQTANFRETIWEQRSNIHVNGESMGTYRRYCREIGKNHRTNGNRGGIAGKRGEISHPDRECDRRGFAYTRQEIRIC